MSGWDQLDESPRDPWVWIGIAVIVAVVLLAMVGALDLDDTRVNEPAPPTTLAYVHPEPQP